MKGMQRRNMPTVWSPICFLKNWIDGRSPGTILFPGEEKVAMLFTLPGWGGKFTRLITANQDKKGLGAGPKTRGGYSLRSGGC